jgi:hypothetical protein
MHTQIHYYLQSSREFYNQELPHSIALSCDSKFQIFKRYRCNWKAWSHATLLQLLHTEWVTSHARARGHSKIGRPIRSHGQECNLQYDSNRTVHHRSHLGTRTQFVDSKQATPTAFDPCPPVGVPTTTLAITAIYASPSPAPSRYDIP